MILMLWKSGLLQYCFGAQLQSETNVAPAAKCSWLPCDEPVASGADVGLTVVATLGRRERPQLYGLLDRCCSQIRWSPSALLEMLRRRGSDGELTSLRTTL
jgi:hypothetical protein